VGEGVVLTPEDAREEAAKRLRVLEAGEPGGLLTPEVCSACLPEPQEEPPPQFSHQDHLVAHALYFRKLLDQEHKRHRNTARLFAQWCAEAYRKRNKRPEDILREQQEEIKNKRRQLIKDLQKQFDLVRAEVDKARLARWEEERKAENQQALDQALEKSTMLFAKRRQDIYGTGESDMDGTSEDVEGEENDEDESVPDEDESNMSTSDTESEANDVADDDEALTAEELRLKYANLPETDLARIRMSDTSVVSSTPQLEYELTEDDGASHDPSLAMSTPNTELDEVDPMLLDGSDESTDMDDDMGESDEGDESEEDDDEDDDNQSRSSDDGPGLLGFFSSSKDALLDDDGTAEADEGGEDEDNFEDQDEVSLVPTGPPEGDEEYGFVSDSKDATEVNGIHEAEPSELATPPTDMEVDKPDETADSNVDKLDEPTEGVEISEEAMQSRDDSSQASPETIATKPSGPESISSYEAPPEKHIGATNSSIPVGLKTPIPHLLRGTLREYQHYGLDWLAGLYTNRINGILADEMGLGKTIQTIALLAHLAVEHEVWGPHLVVVPTSVILNWEMEFKKWCPGFKIMTYYGNQEERKQKRRGWTNDSSWDVLITSYQLVLQDQQVLKRRNWHYMVLDEAHNIKNFRSQRWQALLTFKTRARLLLTGTPLQNNLTELWSLLFFLMPSDGDDAGVEGFADLKNFSEWFRRPVEQILEHGREIMDDEAKKVVTKLHTVLRPYLLRRLKADVEKQMPGKYEHVVYCRLSKRQRYLYDGFMSRAQTKETLASGNYLSIINCLMQLRKVCNHPDLFETRQVSTSFAMSNSVASEYGVKETMVRRRLLYQHPFERLDLDFLNLAPISREDLSRRLVEDSSRIMAFEPLKLLRERQYKRTNWQMQFDGSSVQAALESMENSARKQRMNELESSLYFESKRHGRRPVWGKSLIAFLTIEKPESGLSSRGSDQVSKTDQLANQSSILASMILSVEERARAMEGYVQKFACLTPAALAAGTLEATLVPLETRYFNQELRLPAYDPFHEAQMRLSIAFPDKRLLQYDCGKLQRLAKLLRDLQAGGHRALIFTQMTKMLDILEQFLNIHGHRYLRLDGTTKVEQRQMLTERFNNDNRILAFILSTRSGGLGINLTGADTVIFYDLDWNPAMDKQCQDRCHRIGQTRDVHIYRFVSEHTIESNILRKANQKRMLDDVVIQEGEFTTDYLTKLDVREMIDDDIVDGQDEASKAMDRVLDTRTRGGAGASAASTRVFEQAEDKEDIDAARTAEKELQHADDGDFEEGMQAPSGALTKAGTPVTINTADPDSSLLASPRIHAADEDVPTEPGQPAHIDDYLLRFMEWNLKDEPLQLPADKIKKKTKKGGKEHRIKRRR
jgi:helicase SWR1